MTDPMEATEEFKAWAITETQYVDCLKAAGCPDDEIERLLDEGLKARFQSMKHEKDGVYA